MSKYTWVVTQHSWIPKIKSHHALHHITTEHCKARISPNLLMVFQKAFPLVFILNKTGQDPPVLWNYDGFVDEEHSAVSTPQLLQPIPASQAAYVSGHTEEYVFLFTLLNKPRKNIAQSQRVERVFWFVLFLPFSSRWQDTKGGHLHVEQVLLLFTWSREVQRFLSPSPLPENRRIIWNTST